VLHSLWNVRHLFVKNLKERRYHAPRYQQHPKSTAKAGLFPVFSFGPWLAGYFYPALSDQQSPGSLRVLPLGRLGA
jgi:hypothetical protein